MIDIVAIGRSAEAHKKQLDEILTDCLKELVAAHKNYTVAHQDNERAHTISKRDAAKRKEDKTYARTFEIRQKDYEEKLASAMTLFQHSETRSEGEFKVAMEAILKRYSDSAEQEVGAFVNALLPAKE